MAGEVRGDRLGPVRAWLRRLWSSGEVKVATFAAVIALVSAAVSAFLAYSQLNAAKAQNVASEQLSLVDLITQISNKLQAIDTGQTQLPVQATLLAYAAQGTKLVDELGPKTVPPADDFELGQAFEKTEEYNHALIAYRRAASGNDTHYKVFALRQIAQIMYRLARRPPNPGADVVLVRSEIRIAEHDMNLARNAYKGQPYETALTIGRSGAYNDLFDITFGTVDCGRWKREMADAYRLMAQDPLIKTEATGPGSVEAQIQPAQERLSQYCS